MMKYSKPMVLSAGEGKRISVPNSTLFLKLSGEAVSNKFSITEYQLAPGFPGPPAHKHKVFEHAWYVLEGELTIFLKDEKSILTKGDFLFIPKMTVHAFANQSEAIVKVLVIDTPGGFEKYYNDLQAAFSDGKEIDKTVMQQIQLKYDTYPPEHLF